jgi:hypothetical protein
MKLGSVCPQPGSEFHVGPTGKTLLPLTVKRPGADPVAQEPGVGVGVGVGVGAVSGSVPSGVPWQTAAARREQG